MEGGRGNVKKKKKKITNDLRPSQTRQRVHHKDLKMNVSFTAGRQQICFVDYVEGGEDD